MNKYQSQIRVHRLLEHLKVAHCNAGRESVVATGRTIRGSNPGKGKIFRTRPHQRWDAPSLLYKGYWVSFPELKLPGRGIDYPPPSSAEVEERSRAIPLLPIWAFMACSRVNFTLYSHFNVRDKCFCTNSSR